VSLNSEPYCYLNLLQASLPSIPGGILISI